MEKSDQSKMESFSSFLTAVPKRSPVAIGFINEGQAWIYHCPACDRDTQLSGIPGMDSRGPFVVMLDSNMTLDLKCDFCSKSARIFSS